MYQLSNLVNLLNANGEISNEITKCNNTESTAPWLYIVSAALSNQETDAYRYHQLDYDKLFAFDFHLTPVICDQLRNAIEQVCCHPDLSSDMVYIDILYYQLDQIQFSWWQCRNDFENHMYLISKLAKEVMRLLVWYEWEFDDDYVMLGYDRDQYHLLCRLEIEVIQPVRVTLVTTAYDIINCSNYGRDGPININSNDISILYFLFELYSHSISVAGFDPPTFEKSLQYRAQFDVHQYQCLHLYDDLHERISPSSNSDHYAIEDMLHQLGSSELARILKNVYPHPDKNDDSVLHWIASHTGYDDLFFQLFPHFTELWFSKNRQGLTPMAIIWRVNYDLNVLFRLASNNPEFFGMLG